MHRLKLERTVLLPDRISTVGRVSIRSDRGRRAFKKAQPRPLLPLLPARIGGDNYLGHPICPTTGPIKPAQAKEAHFPSSTPISFRKAVIYGARRNCALKSHGYVQTESYSTSPCGASTRGTRSEGSGKCSAASKPGAAKTRLDTFTIVRTGHGCDVCPSNIAPAVRSD